MSTNYVHEAVSCLTVTCRPAYESREMIIRLAGILLVFSVSVVHRGGGDLLYSAEDLQYNVTVVADGPTLLGATTSFVARLDTDVSDFQETTYIYTWTEEYGYLIPYTRNVNSNENCSFSRPYTRPQEVRDHIMSVKVHKKNGIKLVMVAEGSVMFQVTEYITAHVVLSQNETICDGPVCTAVTNQSAQLTVSIHDPSGYLQENMLLFDWDFGDRNKSLKTSISQTHVYSKPGHYNVSVNITAIQPTGGIKTGYTNITLLLKDAIHNLTADGLEDVTVGDQRKINITCLGSPPISFCWSIFEGNMTSSLPLMKSCIQTYLLEECRTQINYSFNTSQQYILRVRAANNVSFQVLTADVIPKEPPDLTSDSIAGLVVGICFGVTLTCISIGIISHQIHKERMRHVEVANFNFEAPSRYDSIREHARRLNDARRNASEETPLLNKNPTLDVRWVKGHETVEL